MRFISKLKEFDPLWLALVVQILGFCFVIVWWVLRGQAVQLAETLVETPDNPTQESAKSIPCVSYAPFHRGGINPLNHRSSVTEEHIEADLRLLQTRTNCVRTYGVTQGLDAVPAVAARLGMQVNLGVWLSRDTQQNQIELQRGLELARQYKGVVKRLIVGNEVLLRRELSPAQLGALLSEAKKLSPVPITYADVWEFWLRNAQLSEHVDHVTIHILPYWEDNPVAVKNAAKHINDVAQKVQDRFAAKPIWVGETGWPAAGRQRAGAVPGVVEQAMFFRELTRLKKMRNGVAVDYNVIEAFDQPWKRAFEGAMGGYWGIFDPSGKPHTSGFGKVIEDPGWLRGVFGAIIGAVIGALWAGLAIRLNSQANLKWIKSSSNSSLHGACTMLFPIFTISALGAVAPVQWLMQQQWDRSVYEQCISAGLCLLGLFYVVVVMHCWLTARLQSQGQDSQNLWSGKRLVQAEIYLRFLLLFCAASAALILLLDSRYRPFPWWWFVVPTMSLTTFGSGTTHLQPTMRSKLQLLAVVLALSAAGILMMEGLVNNQALAYCALLFSLAVGVLWPSRINTNNANSAAGAQSSVV